MPRYDLTPEKTALFWSRVDRTGGLNACWNWRGGRFNTGYGYFYVGRKLVGTHRIAYSLANGEIPDGLLVCHTCDNPACCNPTHLWLGTTRDNALDMIAKGRGATGDRNGARTNPDLVPRGDRHGRRTKPHATARGEGCGQSRLTESGVQDIRRRFARGEATQEELAAEYGVTPQAIHLVIKRKNWAHVP